MDRFIDYRQIGIIDGIGSVAVHTGSESRAWAGHKIGHQFVVMGNALVVGVVARISKPLVEKLAKTQNDYQNGDG